MTTVAPTYVAAPPARSSEPSALLRWAFYLFMASLPFESLVFYFLPRELLGWASTARLVAPVLVFAFLVDARIRPWRGSPIMIWLAALLLVYIVRGALDGAQFGNAFRYVQFLVEFLICYNLFLHANTTNHAMAVYLTAATIAGLSLVSGVAVDPEFLQITGRARAFYEDPNVLGKMLVVGILFALGLAHAKRYRTRIPTPILWVAMGIMTAAIAWSGSRGMSLSLVASLLAFSFAKGSIWRRAAAVAVAVGAIAMAGWLFARQEVLVERWRTTVTEQGESGSLGRRLQYWKNALHMGAERPVLGWGAGGRAELAIRLGSTEQQRSAHNTWLEYWMEVGLPGVLAYAGAFIAAGAAAWRGRAGREGVLPLAIFVAVSCFDVTLGNPGKLQWVLFAYLAASATPDVVRPRVAARSPSVAVGFAR